MPNIGFTGIMLIFIMALVLFGPSKLPELGRAIGTTLKEFKKSTKELTADTDEKKEMKPVNQ